MMEFEADRMTGLHLTDEVVLPERDVILEEQNQRIGNNPRAQLGEQIDAALYLNHPYGKPVIGWRHEMEQLSRDDAIGFYRRFYAPNNAVVIVAGDVEPEAARQMAEETYGKVPRHANILPRQRPQEPPPVAVRSLTLADARVEQPILQRFYLVPSFRTAKPGQSEALEVLAHILGSGSNSRLYRALVVDKRVAVSAGAWYDSAVFDMSKFGIYGAPRQGVTLPQLEADADAVLAEVIGKGVSRRRAGTRQNQHDRRGDLRAGQPDEPGALVRHRLDDRRDRRGRAPLAGAHPRGHRRRRAGGGPPLARQAALGHRLSGQGREPAGGEEVMTRLLAALAALAFFGVAPAASAMTIEKIVSPSGIEAWLVREHTVPLVALNYAFHGGSTQDEPDKAGTASLAADLLDEGAGDLDGKTFHERLENHAIELGFQVGRDDLHGSLRTLNEHREEAFDLLRLALGAPRFDADAVERVRGQTLASLRRDSTNPNSLASRRWWETAFPGHPYGRESKGTLESVPRIIGERPARLCAPRLRARRADDLDRRRHRRQDRRRADRPRLRRPAEERRPQAGRRNRAARYGPPDRDQSRRAAGGGQLRRAGPCPPRSGFHGRLPRQSHLGRRHLLVAALPGSARKARARLRRLRQHGLVPARRRRARRHRHPRRPHRPMRWPSSRPRPSAWPRMDRPPTNWRRAKSYLKGAYALSLDTSPKIAAQLTQIQLDKLGIDYIERRGAMIDAVTIDDAKRVAKRLFGGGMLVTVAGRPKGLTSTGE